MRRLDGQDVPRLIGAVVVEGINWLVFPDSLVYFSSIGLRLISAHLADESGTGYFHPRAVIMLNLEDVILPRRPLFLPLRLHVVI
jgi:hypothetical protein